MVECMLRDNVYSAELSKLGLNQIAGFIEHCKAIVERLSSSYGNRD